MENRSCCIYSWWPDASVSHCSLIQSVELLIDSGASPAGSLPYVAAASPGAGGSSRACLWRYSCHVTGAIETRVTSSGPPRARNDSVLHSALHPAWGWPVPDRRSSSGRHKLGPCACRLLALEGRCSQLARRGLGCGSPWGRDTKKRRQWGANLHDLPADACAT